MRIFKVVVVGLGLWILFAGLALWQLNAWPKTPLAWVILLVVGPVVPFVFEAIGGAGEEVVTRLPFHDRLVKRVEDATASKRFSWKRIGVGVGLALPLFVIGVAIIVFVSRLLPPSVSTWWHNNFG